MAVFVLAALKGFQAEVVDNEEIDVGQFGELAVKIVDGSIRRILQPRSLSNGDWG